MYDEVDLAVWEGPEPGSDAEAARTFEALYRQWQAEPDTPPTDGIAVYLDVLLDRYPDLTDLDENAMDDSPWVYGPLATDARGPVLFLNMAGNEVGEAAWTHVVHTARAAGLVCFDPDSRSLVT